MNVMRHFNIMRYFPMFGKSEIIIECNIKNENIHIDALMQF